MADGYRCLPEGKHLTFYRIDGDMVKILGVPHASMDID
ncbi:type II toxin-antitoxin system RelE/ParE family toxin [Nitrosomonas communis]